MKNYKLAIFDFDGTLADSVHAIASGIQAANRDMGIAPVSYETAKSVIGLGFKDIVPIVAPDLAPEDWERYKNCYVSYFLKSDPYLELFPRATDLLSALRAKGIKTGIATGKTRKGLSRIVTRLDIGRYFDYSVTSDEAKPKPDPLMIEMQLIKSGIAREEAVMIGDTEHDIRLAENAGIDVIAVSWGAADRAKLQRYRPDAIADSMTELAAMLGVTV